MSRRWLRVALTLLVTGLCIAYILDRIHLGRAGHELAHADLAPLLGSFAIMAGTVPVLAWRWQKLLQARGLEERLPWLLRTYFVGYTAGQILPTALGGDAARVYATTRRRPGTGGIVTGTVLLERALGGAATLALAAVGFVLALGRYDVGAYLWLELAFVVGTVALAVILFSRSARPLLRLVQPLLRALRVERPLREVYLGLHAYRDEPRLLGGMFGVTLAVQAVRIIAIWLAGESVGVGLSPRPYYVLGPLLFLVMLVPFTLNGIAVREAFFVSFLGGLGVDRSLAFDTGFLFFLVTVALALPGAVVLAWETLRGGARPAARRA